jgi:hypothetical protein
LHQTFHYQLSSIITWSWNACPFHAGPCVWCLYDGN